MSRNGESEVPVDFQRAARRPQRLVDELKQQRKPPHSIEAEQGVLGCILLCPGECIDQCETIFKGEEVFYDLRHSAIWKVMQDCWRRSRVLDVVAALEYLRRKDQLDAVGGVAYLASLPDAVPSAANLLYYVDIVMDHFVLRRMLGFCSEYFGRIYEGASYEIEKFFDEFERDAFAIASLRQSTKGEGKCAQYLVEHQERLEETWKAGGHGLLTGFPDLDDQIGGGLDSGDLFVIAAGPSEGKTTLAQNILAHQARQKIPTAFFSMEMPGERIVARMASEQSGIPLKRVRKGLDQEDHDRYATAMKQIAGWPLWICDESGMTIGQIRSRSRRFKAEHKIELIGIDFLQLVEPGIRSENRNHAVGHIAKQAKAMAMELEIPVILLSQLSRDFKKQQRRPTLHDLRESGDVEAAADKIAFLHRDNKSSEIMQIYVDKNRNEDKGRLELVFNAPVFRFEPLKEDAGI